MTSQSVWALNYSINVRLIEHITIISEAETHFLKACDPEQLNDLQMISQLNIKWAETVLTFEICELAGKKKKAVCQQVQFRNNSSDP